MRPTLKRHADATLALIAALALNASASGCGRSSAESRSIPSTPAPHRPVENHPVAVRDSSRVARARVMVMGIMAHMPTDTIRLSAEEPPREPAARYPSLDAACDSVEAILRRATVGVTGVTLTPRAAARFQYWYARSEGAGMAFQIEASDSCPNDAIQNGLRAAGWVENYGYSADGPDGSTLGFVSREFLCLVEARWDGGDDTDTTYVPQPGCQITITCAPRRSDDAPH